MVCFAGLDVSMKATSVCAVDDAGKVILEQRAPTEPAEAWGVRVAPATRDASSDRRGRRASGRGSAPYVGRR
jgi:predicted NBD/HSP70 family sugar kinase